VSTYNRVVAADSSASLAPTVRARLATEMADPTSDVGASLSNTFDTTINSPTFTSLSAGRVGSLHGPASTISDAAGTSSTIAGASLIARTDTAFRVEGLNEGDTGSHIYFKATTGSSGTAGNPWRVSFLFDGDVFEVKGYSSSSPRAQYRVWVDGQPLSPIMNSVVATGNFVVRVAFPDARKRRITLEVGYGFYFGGVWIDNATYGITAPDWGNESIKLAVLGDSVVYGAGINVGADTATQQARGFVSSLARALDMPNTINLGVGSTGWTVDKTTSATAVKFIERLADLYTFNPDYIIIPGSQNDRGATVGAIETAVATGLSAIATNLPSATTILTSVLFPATPTMDRGSLTVERRDVMDAEILAAATAAGVDVINVSNWFDGDGRIGTPGGGNSDFFRTSTDWSHPSEGGHDYIARRLVPEVRRIMGI